MCGDGANDCGALKAAHAGISLSDAESSVASPFTSKNPNITCVPNVIKEGRAALVTSFGIFKYMASYSLCQFISVMILYSIDSNLSDIQYLYIDLFIISIFAFFFGKTGAYAGKLAKQTPLTSLISVSPILSLILQILLVIIFQVAAFEHVQFEEWFVPYNATDNESPTCYENYTIFAVSSFQYVILAIVFSKGKPYRESIFSNYGFILSALGLTAFSAYLILDPAEILRDSFELLLPPVFEFRLYVLIYPLIHFVCAIFIEVIVIEHYVFKKLRFKYHEIDRSKRKYLAIERDLHKDAKWPILSSEFKTSPSPQTVTPTPNYTAEIVVEDGNTFEKNHVLNSFFRTKETTTLDEIQLQPANLIENNSKSPTKSHASAAESVDKNYDIDASNFMEDNFSDSIVSVDRFHSPKKQPATNNNNNNNNKYSDMSDNINNRSTALTFIANCSKYPTGLGSGGNATALSCDGLVEPTNFYEAPCLSESAPNVYTCDDDDRNNKSVLELQDIGSR